ncbi:hypothetical protein [Actinoplanes regularis]|uniref:ABC-type nickel/cobalt efflux system, permease component RcnA n=1 Tax=Actinoplanes regularis TaxID=52697 RepID=A0A239K966_9ACTN|nr:hypothetical protein [Actinoplanes regularis]GIE92457.1 hypothetical protein Are01nite_89370 [Actinoplanes regularis]SNT14288.1 ABC-type nickel/cobalt efflux system, permease component RcnA [Actinoplanes regularis]
MRTYRLGAIVACAATAGVLAWPASPAAAHPLGNFSVNQYAGLTLHPDRVEVTAVVDIAEIPTLQDRARADGDRNGDLSPAERAGYAGAECARLAAEVTVSAGGRRLVWTVTGQGYEVTPAAGGLHTSRLDCRLSAPAPLTEPTEVRVGNGYRADRIGWRELTATGDGVRLTGSPLPTESVTGQLRSYPRDLLTSALDVRTATIQVDGIAAPGTPATAGTTARPAISVAAPGWLATAQNRMETVLGGPLTPLVVGLAFLLALLLGAGHAVLPGHGKTVMAAYFAGRRGRVRDAVAVGATVTLTHTGGVLLLGLVLSTSTALAGERVLSALGVASGLIVVTVGAGMLVAARRARSAGAHSHGPHGHHHHGPHDHGPHGHHHHGPHDHGPHDHGPHGHHHHDPHDHGPHRGRLGLAGIGLAGGLVPSPSALVVLLGAIGLGRAGLGVALVVAYGVGMAGTLTAVGLLLVVAQHRLTRLIAGSGRAARFSLLGKKLAASTPTATAALVVIVGLGIGVRALA